MAEKSIDELKKKLGEILTGDDLKKLELANTPQDLLGLMAKVGGDLTNRLNMELVTRDPNEPSDTLSKLISLRSAAVHFLKDEEQQKLLNEHWGQILIAQLGIAEKATVNTQKQGKDSSQTATSVIVLLHQFEEETRGLEALQRESAQGGPATPTPTSGGGLRAKLKELIKTLTEKSPLFAVMGDLAASLKQKLQQAVTRQDTALNVPKSPNPFPTKPKPDGAL